MIYTDAHSHVHLCKDPENEIIKAEGLGMEIIICNAMGESDWDRVIELAKKYKIIKPCLGIHPAEANNLKPGWDKRLELQLRKHPEAMVGEAGMDKTMDGFEQQKEVFECQMDLAEKLRRPLNIHCYRA